MSAASWVLWGSLAALAGARLALGLEASMAAWGLNVLRFLGPLEGWGLWGLGALTLVPALSDRIDRSLGRLGATLAGAPLRWYAAMGMAALVLLLPDRTWVTGDFLLRDMAQDVGAPGEVFRQALPLELLLNRDLPALAASPSGLESNLMSRLLGAVGAAGLALLAAALTRAWGLTGRARVAAVLVVLFGGYLTVFTGLAKPAGTLGVLAVAIAWGATRLARTGRGGAILGVSLALALLTHRSALAFVPVWLAALAALAPLGRRGGPGEAPARRELLLAVVPPLVALAAIGPRVWTIVRTFDLGVHVVRAGDRAGPLAAALAPLHLLDLANLVLLFAPALLPALALLAFERRARPDRTDLALLLALALPFVALMLFIHPTQGVFRDLDVFAPAGVALALLAARVLGAAFQSGALAPWLAPALAAAVVVPALQWLLHFHDATRGFERARAFGIEAPARDPSELARLWDALTYRDIRRGDWRSAVEAAERSVALAPHPRARLMLGLTQVGAGDSRAARGTFLALAERYPREPMAWAGLLGAALWSRDTALARRAMDTIRSYPPDGRETRLIRQLLRKAPYLWPDEDELRALEAPGPGPGTPGP